MTGPRARQLRQRPGNVFFLTRSLCEIFSANLAAAPQATGKLARTAVDAAAAQHEGLQRLTVTVTLPILPVLARTLEAGPCGDLTFIVGERGQPLTKESFGNMFSEAARAAGVRKSAHGVRKIAATRAANSGATVAQLNAIFGWSGSSMAELYTREATASGCPSRRCTSWRTLHEHLYPHLMMRCGAQR